MNVTERVQASIRTVNATEREAIVAGPFTLYRNRASDHPYLNYAVPNAGVRRWEGIDELRAAFAAEGLQPRLEFVAECAPGLEEALAADGFSLQGRYPVMTLPAEQLREVPAPDGVIIARVLVGGDVRALLATAAEAFGDGPPTDAQVAAYGGRRRRAGRSRLPQPDRRRRQRARGHRRARALPPPRDRRRAHRGVRRRRRGRGSAAVLPDPRR